ncbi:MAG: hypothetical protein CBC89_04735 [Euryarchaeota archaeon TMED129]|nr:MAG: hypothetical protein CBC89_04735 [Euryarchaeota archaeon TMED129]
MTLPKNKKIEQEHIESMKIAVDQYDIRAIHPDKMEEFAEHLVQKARNQEPTSWRTGSPLEE